SACLTILSTSYAAFSARLTLASSSSISASRSNDGAFTTYHDDEYSPDPLNVALTLPSHASAETTAVASGASSTPQTSSSNGFLAIQSPPLCFVSYCEDL